MALHRRNEMVDTIQPSLAVHATYDASSAPGSGGFCAGWRNRTIYAAAT